jgi:hypothetical protein
MVELPPRVMVGLFVALMAAPATPENPAVLPVLNVPFTVTVHVAPNVMLVVPAFMVDPDDTVIDFEALSPMAKLLVFVNKLPELTSPTLIVPVTLLVVITAPKFAPVAEMLLMLKLL